MPAPPIKTLQLRRGTKAQIISTTPTPYQVEGEMAYATDTKEFYISDGTAFNLLCSVTVGNHITDLKTDYTTGDLDTEAKIISAINSQNIVFNTLLSRLETKGILKIS